MDLRVAGRLYADLAKAQAALAVIIQLHLLYLVTPYDMMDTIQPCAGVYLDMVSFRRRRGGVGMCIGGLGSYGYRIVGVHCEFRSNTVG